MKNGTLYFVGTEKLCYFDATIKCLNLGLNLVSIETNEKLGLLTSISKGIVPKMGPTENLTTNILF